MLQRFKSIIAAPLLSLYGLYVCGVFLVLGTAALVVIILPGFSLEWRRSMAHGMARIFLFAAGIPVAIRGTADLPSGPCVVVANHASYLDGVVLKAMLPARFCFVIKKEIVRVPLAGTLLRRIGSEFVDRFNQHSGAVDTRRILKAAVNGQALVFFPEGTFIKDPGLKRFHTGAFVIAARAQLPVVPIAIQGTRWILPDGRRLPRPGSIEIRVLPAIEVEDELDRHARVPQLRDQARASLMAALGEPDLADLDGVAALETRKS